MREIPKITKVLILLNVGVFVLQQFGGLGNMITGLLALFPVQDPKFEPWQPLTYMFLHGGWTHLFFNMFALWMFGGLIERTLGEKRYMIYYAVCGIGAALCQIAVQFIAGSYAPTVGASGAIYGILLAFGMLYPEEKMFVFPIPIPIKAKWFVVIYAVIELGSAMANTGDGVAHMAHLGGMLFGWLLLRYWRNAPARRKQRGPRVSSVNPDWEDNARRKRENQEIDAILDKIRRSGYDSLSPQEKLKLFENSNR